MAYFRCRNRRICDAIKERKTVDPALNSEGLCFSTEPFEAFPCLFRLAFDDLYFRIKINFELIWRDPAILFQTC